MLRRLLWRRLGLLLLLLVVVVVVVATTATIGKGIVWGIAIVAPLPPMLLLTCSLLLTRIGLGRRHFGNVRRRLLLLGHHPPLPVAVLLPNALLLLLFGRFNLDTTNLDTPISTLCIAVLTNHHLRNDDLAPLPIASLLPKLLILNPAPLPITALLPPTIVLDCLLHLPPGFDGRLHCQRSGRPNRQFRHRRGCGGRYDR
mmetsp:Transcript_7030/g.15566  ORF Transcript_7030/g.15566 Transcript_7030/m.15566 type:complete len:200 (+) Transcript_7030:1095-1694(+)